jgi:hypothetical protein
MDKKNLVFFCKTYRNDLKSFQRLLLSFHKHNADKIMMYVSVPMADIDIFKKLESSNIIVVADESYAGNYLAIDSYWGLSLGYINQEICKLSFWEADFCENYLCVDSDAYFIRDFFIIDFIAEKNIPFSVLVMDKDLYIEKHYQEFGRWRKEMIKKIFKYIEFDDNRLLTCHGMTVLNRCVLEDLKKNLLDLKNKKYADLIEISPYEYSWYNAWLQKSNVIPIFAVEPFFKTFHMRLEYVFSKSKLITEEDLAQQYVGIVLNSNWYPKKPPLEYGKISRLNNILYNFLKKQ